MMKVAWISLLVLQSSLALGQQAAQPLVPPPDDGDPILVEDAVASGRRSTSFTDSTTQTGIVLKVSSAEGSPVPAHRLGTDRVGTVRLHSALLSKPAEVTIEPGKAFLGMSLPAELSRLTLTLDETQYQLYFLRDSISPVTGMRHVLMDVLNDEEAVARFSISADGKEVYGTLRTEELTYVFEPTPVPGELNVYRYRGAARLNDRRSGIVGRSALARRHHQIEALAQISPRHSWSSERRAFVIGGALGAMKSLDAASFARVGARLADLTGFSGAERFQVESVRTTQEGGKIAAFSQLVNGIPVDAVNEVTVDRAGNIQSLATFVVPENVTTVAPLLLSEAAQAKALIEWNAKHARSARALSLKSPPALRYRFNAETNTVHPFFAVRFSVEGTFGSHLAVVDGVSGAVQLTDLIFQEVDYVSCANVPAPIPGQPVPPPPISSCTQPNAAKGYAHPVRTGYCSAPANHPPTSQCNVAGTVMVYDVMNDIRNTLPGAIATNPAGTTPACCAQMTDLQIIRHLPNSMQTSQSSEYNIAMPSKDSNSAEILAHEVGHTYTNLYNDHLQVSGTIVAGAVRESTSDLFGILIGRITGRTTAYGTGWVHGDGANYPAADSPRSATNPSYQYWQDMLSAPNGHVAGQVLLRFYYELQQLSGISDQRLLGLVLGAATGIRDFDGVNGIDIGDFRAAVLRVVGSSETSLRNAVSAAYARLYNPTASSPWGPPLPVGDPGPVGAPAAPSIWGSFSHCANSTSGVIAVYSMNWSPVANATAYVGWAKLDSETLYRYGADVPASQTNMWLIGNGIGDGRVSSCNGAGCSGLSISRVVANQPCSGW